MCVAVTVLVSGATWPAAVKGATLPADELVARLTGAGLTLPEELLQRGRRRVEQVLGNQVGIRFTTKVDIVKRGVVTVTVGSERGGEMRLVKMLSVPLGLGALCLSVTLAVGVGEEAKPRDENADNQDFSTELQVLEGVGPTDQGQKVLHLHIEEENRDSFLEAFYNVDPTAGKLEPIWRFEPGSHVLAITHPSHKNLAEELSERLRSSRILKNGRVAEDARVLITHRLTCPKGAGSQGNSWLQLLRRWAYRLDKLPVSLDIEGRSGGPRVGAVPGLPRKAKVRFLEKVEILAVKSDGTTKVRYGSDEFVLPPGKRWPAPLKGRTVLTGPFLKQTGWTRTDLPEKVRFRNNLRMERVLGDQVGIRLTTKVDIVNRGIVTVYVAGAKEDKQ